jgi:hypothetical protein
MIEQLNSPTDQIKHLELTETNAWLATHLKRNCRDNDPAPTCDESPLGGDPVTPSDSPANTGDSDAEQAGESYTPSD